MNWKDKRIQNSGSFYALSDDMFSAADFMHRVARVVHYDYKPENALVTADKNGKLVCRMADFGCCKAVGAKTEYRGSPGYRVFSSDGGFHAGIDSEPSFFANVLYIARELFSPWEQPVDGTADVYSLSRIVYYYSTLENFGYSARFLPV